MPHAPALSVIVTSYNQEKTLRLLFASLARQSWQNFEVVVADDGSKDGTEEFCRTESSFPVQFITQEDLGYRKSKILNQAIRSARAEYLVFLDGDIILERRFLADHLYLRKKGAFVCGRRVDLGADCNAWITTKKIQCGSFDRISWRLIWSAWRKQTLGLKRAWRIPSEALRRLLGYHRPIDLLGSNFSAWKSDIVEVNGFDESLQAYWGEDGDLFIRLRNSGKIPVGAKGLCIQYHLFHPRRAPSAENIKKVRKRF